MTLSMVASWLPSALLLLQVSGTLTLRGPSTVTGTVGGSLSVQCQYEEQFREHIKYWCKSPCLVWPSHIVETTQSKREARSGRVSIRDHPANLTFTVTLDSLTEEDNGSYKCGIDISWGPDSQFQVEVSVFPDPSMKIFTSSLGPPSSLLATRWPSMTPWSNMTALAGTSPQVTPDPRQHPWLLLSSVHFLLLVFVELPLFLSMLTAVLWVNRPQRNLKGMVEAA